MPPNHDPRVSPPLAGAGRFPNGGRFVFTILDDTDDATTDNVAPIYALLHDLGFRTTKTAWANDCPDHLKGPFFAADTLRDPRYLDLVRRLVGQGFELAFHNATMGSSRREETEEALRFLQDQFGQMPRVHCNHGQNRENLYWGPARYRSLLVGPAVRVASRLKRTPRYEGEVEDSPYFWGDLSLQHFDYVRGLAFARVDTSDLHPVGPYRDPSTPWVKLWFTTSDAPDARHFKNLMTPGAVERLADNGGICILSTHLGKGFVDDGRVDPDVERILRHLAGLPGWFAPVSEVLDFLRGPEPPTITEAQRLRLETAHVLDRVVHRIKDRYV